MIKNMFNVYNHSVFIFVSTFYFFNHVLIMLLWDRIFILLGLDTTDKTFISFTEFKMRITSSMMFSDLVMMHAWKLRE